MTVTRQDCSIEPHRTTRDEAYFLLSLRDSITNEDTRKRLASIAYRLCPGTIDQRTESTWPTRACDTAELRKRTT